MSSWYLPIIPFFKKHRLYGVIIILLIGVIGELFYNNYLLTQENDQLRFDTNGKGSEIQELRSELGEAGDNVSQYTGNQRNITDFEKNWDTSQFYKKNNRTYCPKHKQKNYQRIFYNYETPVTSSKLHLKFKIEDEKPNITNYTQRAIVGLELNHNIYSEFDIPTRNSQMVNFRIASDSGGLKSGGEGKPLSSPIKDNSIIDLIFRTQYKSDEEVSQFADLSYKSAVEEYGNEDKSINYDSRINEALAQIIS